MFIKPSSEPVRDGQCLLIYHKLPLVLYITVILTNTYTHRCFEWICYNRICPSVRPSHRTQGLRPIRFQSSHYQPKSLLSFSPNRLFVWDSNCFPSRIMHTDQMAWIIEAGQTALRDSLRTVKVYECVFGDRRGSRDTLLFLFIFLLASFHLIRAPVQDEDLCDGNARTPSGYCCDTRFEWFH